MKPLLINLTIEYDVVTYQINQKVVRSGVVHNQPLLWDIPTLEQARLILDKISIKGAKISKQVEYYDNDQEAQEHRLSALSDTGIISCVHRNLPTNGEPGGLYQ
tara:strand:+ start:1021 stop:1332 length:312 start_codon:yes stop_codon:yes gene_type:complete